LLASLPVNDGQRRQETFSVSKVQSQTYYKILTRLKDCIHWRRSLLLYNLFRHKFKVILERKFDLIGVSLIVWACAWISASWTLAFEFCVSMLLITLLTNYEFLLRTDFFLTWTHHLVIWFIIIVNVTFIRVDIKVNDLFKRMMLIILSFLFYLLTLLIHHIKTAIVVFLWHLFDIYLYLSLLHCLYFCFCEIHARS